MRVQGWYTKEMKFIKILKILMLLYSGSIQRPVVWKTYTLPYTHFDI